MRLKRVRDQRTVRRPRRRVIDTRPDKGAFFPGEVARMLNVDELDNQRIRRIFNLVRQQRHAPLPPKKEWARFDYVDIACTIEVVRICVDRDRLSAGDFRVALLRLRRACTALYEQGLENPLLQARLDLSGDQVIATVHGTSYVVETGQRLLSEAVAQSSRFMREFHGSSIDDDLVFRLEQERSLVERQSTGNYEARWRF
jgi:hypothetical protein